MQRHRAAVGLAALVALAAIGCAKPPLATIEEARRAVEKAAKAGAGTYAPESLAAAERAFAALENELAVQNKRGRLFRSYLQAESLGLEALVAAERAAYEAERESGRLGAEARSAVARAAADLSEAEAAMGSSASRIQDAGELRAARELLERARSALAAGRFSEALDLARSAAERTEAARREPSRKAVRPPRPVKARTRG